MLLRTGVLISTCLAWVQLMEDNGHAGSADRQGLSGSSARATGVSTARLTSSTPSVVVKRQASVVRGLSALWHYNCPRDGAQTRVFKWKGTLQFQPRELILDPILNVSHFDDITLTEEGDWWSAYHGQFCIVLGDMRCTYTFRGAIEGSIYRDSLSMSMVTGGNDRFELPEVEEYCVSLKDNPAITCLVTHGVACVVTRVDISLIGSRR